MFFNDFFRKRLLAPPTNATYTCRQPNGDDVNEHEKETSTHRKAARVPPPLVIIQHFAIVTPQSSISYMRCRLTPLFLVRSAWGARLP